MATPRPPSTRGRPKDFGPSLSQIHSVVERPWRRQSLTPLSDGYGIYRSSQTFVSRPASVPHRRQKLNALLRGSRHPRSGRAFPIFAGVTHRLRRCRSDDPSFDLHRSPPHRESVAGPHRCHPVPAWNGDSPRPMRTAPAVLPTPVSKPSAHAVPPTSERGAERPAGTPGEWPQSYCPDPPTPFRRYRRLCRGRDSCE